MKTSTLLACLIAISCCGCGENRSSQSGNTVPSLNNVAGGPTFRTVNASFKNEVERLLLAPEVDSLVITGLDANSQILFGPQVFNRNGDQLSLTVPVATAKIRILPKIGDAAQGALSLAVPAFSETAFDGQAQEDNSPNLQATGTEITSLTVSPNPVTINGQQTVTATIKQSLNFSWRWSNTPPWSFISDNPFDQFKISETIGAPPLKGQTGMATLEISDSTGKKSRSVVLQTILDGVIKISQLNVVPGAPGITNLSVTTNFADSQFTTSWQIAGVANALSGNSVQFVSSTGGYYNVVAKATASSSSDSVQKTIRVDSPNSWPSFHNDLQHTGRSSYNLSNGLPAIRWSLLTGRAVNSSPAVGNDGTVYVGSNDGKLYAINPDGSLKWSFSALDAIQSSPALAADGTLYVGSDDGRVYAINPDGTKKWEFLTGSANPSSPLIGADGTVYLCSSQGRLLGLNPNGQVVLNKLLGAAAKCSPVLSVDGTLYIGDDLGRLHSVARNGTLNWSFQAGGTLASSPAIASDGTIIIGCRDRKVYAVNPNGSLRWSYQTGNEVNSSPAIASDGTIYIGSDDGKLYALRSNGALKWSYQTNGPIFDCSPAIAADGTIVFGSADKSLRALSPNGIERWTLPLGGTFHSSPAIAKDGSIAIGTDNFRIYSIR